MKSLKFTLITLCAVTLFTACEDKQVQQPIQQQEAIQVDVLTIEKKPYPIWVNFSGKTEALLNVNVNARVKGTLQEQFFKAGDYVKKGDLLFQIEDTDYKASVKQNVATLKQNQSNLKLAISKYNRYLPLVKKQLVSQEQLDELISQKETYEAIIESNIAAVEKAKLNLSYTKVTATIDGYIGKALVNTGNTVGTDSSNITLANIVQSKEQYVIFNPSSSIVQTIQQYKAQKEPKVIITLPNEQQLNQSEFEGKVDFIDNKTNESTGTVEMRAIVQNRDNLLLPGTYVNIKLFITDQIPVIAVPTNKMLQNQLGEFVYVVDAQNKIQTRQLDVEFSNKDISIIKEGLKPGDRVVVSATRKLKNNMLVTPMSVSSSSLE